VTAKGLSKEINLQPCSKLFWLMVSKLRWGKLDYYQASI